MQQMRMLMPEELEAVEHIKEMCHQLNAIRAEEKRIKEQIFLTTQSIGRDVRFDVIKEKMGSVSQKYIIEALQDHIPELMKGDRL